MSDAASTDPHDLVVEYIDCSISCQVALGYGPPTAERRLAAIEKAEREFWKLRELTSPGVEVAPAAPSEGTLPRSADFGVSTPGSSAAKIVPPKRAPRTGEPLATGTTKACTLGCTGPWHDYGCDLYSSVRYTK